MDYALWGVSAVVLLCVHVLIAMEYIGTFPSKSDPEAVPKKGGQTPSGHPERYHRRHQERKRPPRVPKLEVTMPNKTSLTTDRVLTIVLGISGLVFPLGDYVPLEITVGVWFAAVAAGAYSLWKWEKAQQWKNAKKVSVWAVLVITYTTFMALPLVKQYEKDYDLHLRFKEHPAFTWWMELWINWNLLKAQNRLKAMHVSPTTYIPPIDVAYGNAENTASPPGEPGYRGGINIAEPQIYQARGQTHAYLFYEVQQILAPDMSKLKTAAPERQFAFILELNDITDYLNSALWEKPEPNLLKSKDSWPAKLWDVRQRFSMEFRGGDRFVDQTVAYALMSLGDNPEEGAAHDPDVYFCRHLKIGEDRVDHDQRKWSRMIDILGDKYWNVCRNTIRPPS